MRRIRERLQREYPVKVYQWVAIWAALLTLMGGAIYGVVVYVNDQADDLRTAELLRCEQRIEGRLGSRARALTNIDYVSSVVDLIDEYVGVPADLLLELSALEKRERELVDEQLPILTLANCLQPALAGGER